MTDVPSPPELLRLWIAIARRRSGMVRAIKRADKVAGDRSTPEIWRPIEREMSDRLHKQLELLDLWIASQARVEPQDRGPTMNQLREKAQAHDEIKEYEEHARRAVLAWIRHRSPAHAEIACDSIQQLRECTRDMRESVPARYLAEKSLADPGQQAKALTEIILEDPKRLSRELADEASDALAEREDLTEEGLVELESRAREQRRDHSGTLEELAKRIVKLAVA